MLRLTLHISDLLPPFPLYLFTFFLPAFPLVLGLNELSSLVFRRGGTCVVTVAISVPCCVTQTCKLTQGGHCQLIKTVMMWKYLSILLLNFLFLYTQSFSFLFSSVCWSAAWQSLHWTYMRLSLTVHFLQAGLDPWSVAALRSAIVPTPPPRKKKKKSEEATCMRFWSTSLG